MNKIQPSDEPSIVTKRGKPLVKGVPADTERTNSFGFMAGEFKIVGDIESPLAPRNQWKIVKKTILHDTH